MSVEDTAAAILTAEQNVEQQQQESNMPSAVENINIRLEAEADVEQPQDSVEDRSESSSSVIDTSVVATESTRPHSSREDDVAVAGSNIQDTQGSSVSGSGSVTEATDGTDSKQGEATDGTDSKQGGATDCTNSKQGGATDGTDSKQGEATDGTDSKQGGAADCTDSKQGGAVDGTDSKQGGATDGADSKQGGASVCGSSSQDSQDKTTLIFCHEGSQETVIVGGSSRRSSLESDAAGEVCNGLDSHDTVTISSTCTGDSQETAVVGDLSRRASLESGVAAGVSNSPDSHESPTVGESIPPSNLPVHFLQAVLRENADERHQVVNDLMSGYQQCCSICARVCNYLRPCSRRIQSSGVFTWVIIILILFSIVVIMKGSQYLQLCPVKPELPALVMAMGIAALFVLVDYSFVSSCCPYVNRYYLLAGTITTRLVFLGLFAAVVRSTYTTSPSFDDKESKDYCDMEFYYFVSGTNFAIATVIVLALCLYVPTISEDYERF